MGATLNIAAEKNGYTLSDRGTYLATRATTGLNILLEGTDSNLMNIYHVIQVNPTKFDKVNGPGGRAFMVFMIDPETQAIIANYGVDKYGEVLFFADATKTEADLGSY
jgi:tungstate transport system substrate-binding protein